MKARVWGILLLGASLAATGCVNRDAQKAAKETAAIVTDQSVEVTVEPARRESVPNTLGLTGSIATGDDLSVSAQMSGRIVAVYVKDGSAVSAGQVVAQQETSDTLARLRQSQASLRAAKSSLAQALMDGTVVSTRSDAAVKASEARLRQAKAALEKALNGSRPEEKRQAKANLDRTKSDLDTANKALDRAKRLHDEGAISKSELEQAENRQANTLAAYTQALEGYNLILDAVRPEDIASARESVRQAEEQLRVDKANQKLDPVAEQRVIVARANVDSAQEQVNLAQMNLEDLKIKAPMSGKVSGKPVAVGTYAAPGAPLMRIIGAGSTYYEAEVPEKDISKVQIGMSVDVEIQALNQILTGTVVAIDPVASDLGRLFRVRIQINESTNALKPGMFASGSVLLGTDNAVTVPFDSIVRDGESAFVFVESGGKAKKVQVKLIRTVGSRAMIDGVQEGDSIIVKGKEKLIDGLQVKVGTIGGATSKETKAE